MEIIYLQEFIELSKTLSFTVAAQRLYTSQPVLSKHIKSLENELQMPLFARNGKSISLTEFGRSYLPYAESVVEQYEVSERWRKEYFTKNNTTIRIGLPESLQLYEINAHIFEFSNDHPQYNIETVESLSTHLIDMYEQGDFRMFLTGMSSDTEKPSLPYKYLEVATGEIKVCIKKGHPLAGKESIHITELAKEKVVLPPFDTLFQQFIEEKFLKVLGYKRDFLYSSYSIAKTLAETGICIALLQEEALTGKMADTLVIKNLEPTISYSRGIGYKPSGLTDAERDYLDFVKLKLPSLD